MAVRNIVYDGNSLQTDHIFTQDIEDAGNPTKNVNMYALAHYNGSKIPYINYTDKKILVSGTIIGDTVPDLDSRIDTFKSFFLNQDRNLDIDFAGSTRRYIATANTVDIKRPGGLLYAKYNIEFYATQPFGQDVNATSLIGIAANKTNYVANPSFEVGLAGWTGGYSGTPAAPSARQTGIGQFGASGNGSALLLGGTTANVATLPAFNAGTSFTIACWVYADPTASSWNVMFGGGNATDTAAGSTFAVNPTTNAIGFGNFTGAFSAVSANITPNTWLHCVATISYSGTTQTTNFYVNGGNFGGSAQTAATSPGNFTAPKIGAYTNNTAAYFKGRIDALKVWNRILTQSEIIRLYTYHAYNGNGLMADYDFDEGNGNTIADNSGNAYNGTIPTGTFAAGTVPAIASLRVTTAPALGYQNFSGGGYIALTGLPTGVNLVVSLWIYGYNASDNATLENFYVGSGSSNTNYDLALVAGWQRIAFLLNPGTAATGSLYFRPRSLNNTFYIDGIQIEQGTAATPYFDGSTAGDNTYSYSWTGTANNSASLASGGSRMQNSYTDNVVFLGTAPSQLMVATITLLAVTSTGSQSITFGNNNNGQQITVTRAWSVNDILVIDTVQRLVTVNSVAADYSGAFPEFKPGAQTLGYSDTFTTRKFSISVNYNVMYL